MGHPMGMGSGHCLGGISVTISKLGSDLGAFSWTQGLQHGFGECSMELGFCGVDLEFLG